ncbi:hypothetical protein EYF80_054621 [Liparis tanakae]|uniref:Uncharacterized protein n=1 Tax=Liparis tanakae TaxID=230148 RepID=A0A4Z2F247_9TELE|nr:hypothetical protein EYF80_054621 [Liparis tanakae]
MVSSARMSGLPVDSYPLPPRGLPVDSYPLPPRGLPVDSYLLEDVLLPHQLLPLPVGFGHEDVQDRLAAVQGVGHEEDHVFQQLDGEPEREKPSM